MGDQEWLALLENVIYTSKYCSPPAAAIGEKNGLKKFMFFLNRNNNMKGNKNVTF